MSLVTPPEVSIVIVNFDTNDFVLECLYSIFVLNEDVDTEVIVIDNSSTDQSVKSIEQFFPTVKLIQNSSNIGFAAASNKGLCLTSGEFVLLLNPDTFLPCSSLRKCIDYLKKNPEIGLLTPKLIKPDGSLDWACKRSFPTPADLLLRMLKLDRLFPDSKFFGHYSLSYLDSNKSTEVECIAGAFMLARRKAVDVVGLLDESFFLYFEDLDWSYKFNVLKWKVFYYSEVVVWHYKRGATRKHESFAIKQFYYALYQGYFKYYGDNNPIFNYIFKFIVYLRMILSLAVSTLINTSPFYIYNEYRNKKLIKNFKFN